MVNAKKRAMMIIFNIVIGIFLLATTVTTIVFAIDKFNMNMGGNVNYTPTDVLATISSGQISNGTVSGTGKMQQIDLTVDNDGSSRASTWQNLEIKFDGREDVVITFTVTNNHQERNLKLTLNTSYTQATNIEMDVAIDGSARNIAYIPTLTDNMITCTITFSLIDVTLSASIEDFSINFELELTDEMPYTVDIDTSAQAYINNLSSSLANADETITFAGDEYGVTSTAVTEMRYYYKEEGSETEIELVEANGEYTFTMPNSNITIYAQATNSYNRLDDYDFEGNAIIGYYGNNDLIVIPAYYDTITIDSVNYIVEKQGTAVTTIGSSFGENTFLESSSWGSMQVMIDISEGVTTIENYAFRGCENIYSVYLPSTINSIGPTAFAQCYGLTEIYIDSAYVYYNASSTDVSATGWLFNNNAQYVYINSSIDTEINEFFQTVFSLESYGEYYNRYYRVG